MTIRLKNKEFDQIHSLICNLSRLRMNKTTRKAFYDVWSILIQKEKQRPQIMTED